jgi:hypothetical protein
MAGSGSVSKGKDGKDTKGFHLKKYSFSTFSASKALPALLSLFYEN